jgi:hypothetical protein
MHMVMVARSDYEVGQSSLAMHGHVPKHDFGQQGYGCKKTHGYGTRHPNPSTLALLGHV